jgi:acyl-CoA thioesterase I
MNKRRTLVAIGAIVMTMAFYMATFQVINAQSMELPHNPIHVACVGDSITQASEYPAKLQLLLGTNYIVGNFGVSGSTVSLNSTKPYMNQTAFQKAEQSAPQIVVIMLGTNDARTDLSQYNSSFEVNYYSLVSSFQKLTSNPQIFVVDSPPIFTNNPDYNNTYLTNDVLPQVDSVATSLNLSTINVYNAFSNHSDYFMDGVHPNSDGAALIASEVCNAIVSQESSSH